MRRAVAATAAVALLTLTACSESGERSAPFNFSQKGYLLPRGDVDWQNYVDTWLGMAKNDGTWANATRPWFGATVLR